MDTRERFTRRHFNGDTTAWLLGHQKIVISREDWEAGGTDGASASRLADSWHASLAPLVTAGYMSLQADGMTYTWNRYAIKVGMAGPAAVTWGVYDTTSDGTRARHVEGGELPIAADHTQAQLDEVSAIARRHAIDRLTAVRMEAAGKGTRRPGAPGSVTVAQGYGYQARRTSAEGT